MSTISPQLSNEAKAALARAREANLSYGVQLLKSPKGAIFAVVGEVHLKLPAASAIGKELVRTFDLRGVESFPSARVFLGRVLYVLIILPRLFLRLITLGIVKDSTIKDAREATHGHTFLLESVSKIPLSLHAASAYLTLFFSVAFATPLVTVLVPFFPPLAVLVPWLAAISMILQFHMIALVPAYFLRRFSWAWLVHPAIGILAARDKTMAEGTAEMIRQHPNAKSALLIMGRAHMVGYARELVEKQGFTVIDDEG